MSRRCERHLSEIYSSHTQAGSKLRPAPLSWERRLSRPLWLTGAKINWAAVRTRPGKHESWGLPRGWDLQLSRGDVDGLGVVGKSWGWKATNALTSSAEWRTCCVSHYRVRPWGGGWWSDRSYQEIGEKFPSLRLYPLWLGKNATSKRIYEPHINNIKAALNQQEKMQGFIWTSPRGHGACPVSSCFLLEPWLTFPWCKASLLLCTRIKA